MPLVVIATTLSCLSALLWRLTSLAAQGRLGRNRFVGIRTATTMASEAAWLAAHVAARVWLHATAVLGFVVALAVVISQSWVVLIVGCALMVGGSLAAKTIGIRAARAATAV